METTLHRQLKAIYAGNEDAQEVVVDGYRIDAVHKECLIEIQQASLAAIRDKIAQLLDNGHQVRVVKPICARKRLIKRRSRRGKVIDRRFSPTRHGLEMLFLEMVHFVNVFPHPALTLEVLLTEQEEERVLLPANRKRKWREKPHRVLDRRLVEIQERQSFQAAEDLLRLMPDQLVDPFTTADLAESGGVPRWLAQKMAYCLRKTDLTAVVGKQGNSLLYSLQSTDKAA